MSAVAEAAVAGPDATALAHAVHRALLDDGVPDLATPAGRAAVVRAVHRAEPLASGTAVHEVTERVLARVGGVGSLAPLLHDDRVSDVLVNGDGRVWVEREGVLCPTGQRMAAPDVLHLLERVLAPLGLRLDRSSPLVDARLPDGSRVNAVVPPLAVDGPCVAIRRFRVGGHPLGTLAPAPVAALLADAVRARRNVVVSGGTGAGKTTLLNALAGEVGPDERIVTVEDTAELRLTHGHVLRFEARPASADGVGAVPIRQLVRNALRLRPDRIVVGEVRGPEALDMLQAMNTGHEGSLTTLHANSPADALRRLETMVLLDEARLGLIAVRDQIAASVDLLVHVVRQSDGSRAVTAVAEPAPEVGDDGRIEVRDLVEGGTVVAWPRRPPRGRDRGAEAARPTGRSAGATS